MLTSDYDSKNMHTFLPSLDGRRGFRCFQSAPTAQLRAFAARAIRALRIFFAPAVSLLVCSIADAQDVSATIRQKTQEFSDAGQRGDGAAMRALLDDDVLFTNEGGDTPTKAEIVKSASAPKGISQHIVVEDWNFRQHGPVGVASFVDHQTVTVGAQSLNYRYRSTEVWLKKDGHWKMIASQTLALPLDPPAVALPPLILDQYVGQYEASAAFRYEIVRRGDALLGSLNGAEPSPLNAEAVDVLFTPGVPRVRKVFSRSADGRVTGFTSRHEGEGLVFTRSADSSTPHASS